MLVIHIMYQSGYYRTAVPETITKPTLSLPLLELNTASLSTRTAPMWPGLQSNVKKPAAACSAWLHHRVYSFSQDEMITTVTDKVSQCDKT